MAYPLCLSPCPLFCSFYWMTCSERTEKLLSVQHYQSPLRRMMKRRKRSWQAPYCRTRRRRAVARVQGKHPHPLGSSLGGGSTTQLNREDKHVRREKKERRMMLTRVVLKASLFPVTKADLKQLTVILHAELLPVDCPLSGNFSTSFKMLHLQQEKQLTILQ